MLACGALTEQIANSLGFGKKRDSFVGEKRIVNRPGFVEAERFSSHDGCSGYPAEQAELSKPAERDESGFAIPPPFGFLL